MVLFAFMLVFILAMVAFAVDMGYVMLVRTQLQVAADSAAMAAAKVMADKPEDVFASAEKFAAFHTVSGEPMKLAPEDVEFGIWDIETRRFTPTPSVGNAIRVTARRDAGRGGEVPLFFARAINIKSFEMKASAVAMANPRDIAFVVDMSGSMNDDSETCWASQIINSTFASAGYPTVGSSLAAAVFEDFNYGSFPGTVEYFGSRIGAPQTKYAYRDLTKTGGVLAANKIDAKYRILKNDSEATRKKKAYSYIIDTQISEVMPNAKPAPSSTANYSYWEKYLDYLIEPISDRSRGRLPPSQDGNRITGFNNPNKTAYPSASSSVPAGYRNYIGYITYVQFMMDNGRDRKPDGSNYVPLSKDSPYCPWHPEDTAGGTFNFPPRSQPVHAARRALIAAMQVVKEKNEPVTDFSQRDWVSIISFDRLSDGGPVIKQTLTADYQVAMEACTQLQATSDIGSSTATDAGIILARQHIRSSKEGGQGRMGTNKVVVLLTDGAPNLYASSSSEIRSFINNSDSNDFYSSSDYYRNGPLMQTAQMRAENWMVFPVGIGLGTDYNFMDRMARMGGSDNEYGESPRGSGNPAEYEQRLADIFRNIITTPQVRLVQ